jgi:hypothetical protein
MTTHVELRKLRCITPPAQGLALHDSIYLQNVHTLELGYALISGSQNLLEVLLPS